MGLQKAINQAVKYCKDWNLKCNLKKTKILVFKKEDRLKNERWTSNDQPIEMADKINYLRVTLENTGAWNTQQTRLRAKGSQTAVAIEKCLQKPLT
jgi:hypothetical protein